MIKSCAHSILTAAVLVQQAFLEPGPLGRLQMVFILSHASGTKHDLPEAHYKDKNGRTNKAAPGAAACRGTQVMLASCAMVWCEGQHMYLVPRARLIWVAASALLPKIITSNVDSRRWNHEWGST